MINPCLHARSTGLGGASSNSKSQVIGPLINNYGTLRDDPSARNARGYGGNLDFFSTDVLGSDEGSPSVVVEAERTSKEVQAGRHR